VEWHCQRTLIRITTAMDYDETEIAITYDNARGLAQETLRLCAGVWPME